MIGRKFGLMTKYSKLIASFRTFDEIVTSVVLNHDGRYIAVAGISNNTIIIWDSVMGMQTAKLVGHRKAVWVACYGTHINEDNHKNDHHHDAAADDEI
jgi:WD40 repeat protein